MPPELEQVTAPVKGDFVITMYRAPVGAPVPVKGPVAMIIGLPADSGSAWGSPSLFKK
jgi:hypothetical protein